MKCQLNRSMLFVLIVSFLLLDYCQPSYPKNFFPVTKRAKNGDMETSLLPMAFTSNSKPLMIALCITGNERSINRPVIKDSFEKYMRTPLVENNEKNVLHTFMVIGMEKDDASFEYGYRSHSKKNTQPSIIQNNDELQRQQQELDKRNVELLKIEVQAIWHPTKLKVEKGTSLSVNESECEWMSSDDAMGQESVRGFFSQFLKVKSAYELVKQYEVLYTYVYVCQQQQAHLLICICLSSFCLV
jgi:hypothetical protein